MDLGVRAQAVEDGHARLEFQAEHRPLNPAGTVHGGGVLAALVDTRAEVFNFGSEMAVIRAGR